MGLKKINEFLINNVNSPFEEFVLFVKNEEGLELTEFPEETEYFKKNNKKFINKFFEIISDYHEISNSLNNELDQVEYEEKITNILKKIEENLSSNKNLHREQSTLSDQLSFPKEFLDQTFNLGVRLLDSGKSTKQSTCIFWMLAILDPSELNHWILLGHALKSQELFEQAIVSYSIASLIAPENPLPSLFNSECYLKLGNHHENQFSFDEAVRLAELSGEYPDILEIAEQITK